MTKNCQNLFSQFSQQVLAMLSGELEYEEMVENSKQKLSGTISGSINGNNVRQNITDVKIDSESVALPFPVSDHLFIGIFVFFMSIIMINLLFGLAVSDVQVRHNN